MSVVSNFSLIHYGAHQHTAVQFAEDSVPSELQTALSCVYYNFLRHPVSSYFICPVYNPYIRLLLTLQCPFYILSHGQPEQHTFARLIHNKNFRIDGDSFVLPVILFLHISGVTYFTIQYQAFLLHIHFLRSLFLNAFWQRKAYNGRFPCWKFFLVLSLSRDLIHQNRPGTAYIKGCGVRFFRHGDRAQDVTVFLERLI